MPHDYHHHLQYCKWLVWKHELYQGFLVNILCSDKVAFTRESIFSGHNSHLQAQHNPQVTHEWAIKFAGALKCGPVSLAVVWLGHTYYPTASRPCLLCVPAGSATSAALKMCHWQFDVTCGFNTMGHERILVHRPNNTSTHSFLTGG
jgi:hypothetical protein